MVETSRWVLRRELVIRGQTGVAEGASSVAVFCCCAAFIHASRDLWSTGHAEGEASELVGGWFAGMRGGTAGAGGVLTACPIAAASPY